MIPDGIAFVGGKILSKFEDYALMLDIPKSTLDIKDHRGTELCSLKTVKNGRCDSMELVSC